MRFRLLFSRKVLVGPLQMCLTPKLAARHLVLATEPENLASVLALAPRLELVNAGIGVGLPTLTGTMGKR